MMSHQSRWTTKLEQRKKVGKKMNGKKRKSNVAEKAGGKKEEMKFDRENILELDVHM